MLGSKDEKRTGMTRLEILLPHLVHELLLAQDGENAGKNDGPPLGYVPLPTFCSNQGHLPTTITRVIGLFPF
jgi:hypothetical protein